MCGASPLSPPAVRFMLFGSPGSEKRVNRIFFTGAAAPYAPDTFSGVPAGTAAPCLRTYDSLSKVGRNVNIPRHAFYYLGITTDRRSLRTVNARPSEKQGACGSDVIDVKRRADRSVPRGVLKAICARGQCPSGRSCKYAGYGCRAGTPQTENGVLSGTAAPLLYVYGIRRCRASVRPTV